MVVEAMRLTVVRHGDGGVTAVVRRPDPRTLPWRCLAGSARPPVVTALLGLLLVLSLLQLRLLLWGNTTGGGSVPVMAWLVVTAAAVLAAVVWLGRQVVQGCLSLALLLRVFTVHVTPGKL